MEPKVKTHPITPSGAWNVLDLVLRQLDSVTSLQGLSHFFYSHIRDLFHCDQSALFYKTEGRRQFQRLEGSSFVSLALSQIPQILQKTSPYLCNGVSCQHLHFNTSAQTELLLILPHPSSADLPSITTFSRLWAMRWEQILSNREKSITALQLSKIRTITEELGKGMDYKPLLSRILKMTLSLVDADHGLIMIKNESTGLLQTEVMYGASTLPTDSSSNGQGIQEQVMQTRQPIMLERITDFSGTGVDHDTHSVICVPLVKQEQAFGVIYVSNKREFVRFSPQDLDLVCILASNVASVVDQVRLFNRSITDFLTGLYTRRHFEPRLDQELKRVQRYGMPLSILAIDADHFKRINDSYGHQAGDTVLKTIADIIKHNIRADIDLPTRMGGEEFAVLLPETSEEGALILAERIRCHMQSMRFDLGGAPEQITLSIGVATSPQHGVHIGTLIGHADQALYYSKQQGRNQVASYSALLKAVEQPT